VYTPGVWKDDALGWKKDGALLKYNKSILRKYKWTCTEKSPASIFTKAFSTVVKNGKNLNIQQ